MKPKEDSSSMVNGKVGLMTNQSLWGNFKTQRTLANVEISGDQKYQLEYCSSSHSKTQSYRLLSDRGLELDVWKFVNSWSKKKLSLNGVRGDQSKKLDYMVGMFGGTCFMTEEGKKPIFMELTENSRAFELDGMFFKHIDFKSHMHFRCELRRVNQAILVASILFNPPMTFENSG